MIELYTIPTGIPDNIDKDRPVVILDIFRASTSITAALAAGAEKILVAGSMAEAEKLKSAADSVPVMAGERSGFRIEGYDLGNSPREMLPDNVSGKTVIFNSTNGTKLLRRFDHFETVIVGSFVSMMATVDYLSRFENDPVVCCAGTVGRESNEDTLAAGLLISSLDRPESVLDDAAVSAVRLVQNSQGDWVKWARHSFHGRYLASIDLAEDLDFCLDLDRFHFVPVKSGEVLVRSDRL
ncbi:MAG: 2-phosphosulfolactate phosphatase [FCB group bacterium]|nr:2-phosphosulfolactate phosphatase [FCB group bacterium]